MRVADSPRFSQPKCRKVLERYCAADSTLRSDKRRERASSNFPLDFDPCICRVPHT